MNVKFDDALYDETWAAVAVANHIRSQHSVLSMATESEPWDYSIAVLRQAGQPYADTSLFAVNLVTRAMREHVTVALSGDGGDEGFGGYSSHLRLDRLTRFLRIHPALRRIGLLSSATMMQIPASLGRVPHQLPSRLKDFAESTDIVDLIAEQISWVRQREHKALCCDKNLLPIRRHMEPQWKYRPSSASSLEINSALLTEVQVRLRMANDYLPKVDTASMRHSLEVRVPMLDEQLFDFGMTLPHNLKIGDGMGKRILRQLAKRELPLNVAKKPKHGFEMPIDRWVDDDFRLRLSNVLLGPNSVLPEFFHPEVYTPIIQAFSEQRLHSQISRAGLYQRIVMMLGLQVHFGAV